MPRIRNRILLTALGGAAAFAFGAAPASAIQCPPGATGDPLVDYCQVTPNFAATILADNPLAWFRLSEGDGVELFDDSSVNSYTGGFKNRTQSGPIGISGDGNTARDFFGGDGYGYINGIPAPSLANGYLSYTMEAYFYLRETDSPALPLIHNDGTIMQFGGAGAVYIKSNTLRFRNGPDDEVFWPGALSDNTWYMVVARKSGSNLSLFIRQSPNKTTPTYFNPTPDATGTSDYLPGGSPTFYLGYGTWAPWFNGSLDEVSYYSHALTTNQIANHFYADPTPDKGMERVAPHSADSSNPAPAKGGTTSTPSSNPGSNPTTKPSVDPARAAKLKKAKADVKRLTASLKKAQRWVGSLKHHFAPLKAIKIAQKQVATITKQLKQAKQRVKTLS